MKMPMAPMPAPISGRISNALQAVPFLDPLVADDLVVAEVEVCLSSHVCLFPCL